MNGNTLELKTEEILKDNGWEVLTELFYTDPSTQKPREKDIVAQKHYKDYEAMLFVECKSIPNKTVLSKKGLMALVENTLIVNDIPFANISEIERNQKTHFYKKYREFFKSKDSKDFLYKAVNQNLQSFDAFKKSNQSAGIYYLIVVYDGEMFCLDNNIEQKCDKVLIKINTLDNVFNLPNFECFIEVVSIDNFENFLKDIQEDLNTINESINFYRRKEQDRIDKNRGIRKNNNDFGL
jgi:hypothetical protein